MNLSSLTSWTKSALIASLMAATTVLCPVCIRKRAKLELLQLLEVLLTCVVPNKLSRLLLQLDHEFSLVY